MKTPRSPRPRATTFFGIIVASSVLFGLLSSIALSAQQEKPKPQASTIPSAAQTTKPQIAKTREEWHKALLQLPHPKTGCYKASFPRVEWKAVPCGTPPPYPVEPAHGPAKHFIVGNGGSNDFAANPTGTIFGVDGTFPSVSSGITESGPIANSGPSLSDTYTLQINTNQFTSTACMGSPNPNCKGWEQFVYENNPSEHRVFIQYWLIKYNTTCPSAAWTQFNFTGSGDIYCYQSTGTSSLMAGQPISAFNNLKMSAAVTASSDQVVVTVGSDSAMITGLNAVAVAAGWTDAEFNVFGDGGNSSGGGQAGFGASSTIVVETTVHNGTKNAPMCKMESFTGETNNLTLVGTAPIGTQPSPAIEFTESNVPGSMAACVTAAGVGDTHLSTFGGLLYDFQASGDFVLAQTGKDFIVEARQVSGAPTWPSASINKAVATQMGQTRVAFCTPSRLVVDGETTEVGDGKIRPLPGGVDILRTGNVYIVADQNGNSLRAEFNGTYINATVGLGEWPAKVRGILANANGHVNEIEARTGTVLAAPFAFAKLYHEYADSWRVPAKESLLSVCGYREVETGIPQKPFYANDLPPEVSKRTRAVCMAAGVKDKTLLDACTLDVAVIGNESAAKVFVGLHAPAAVGRVVPSRGDHDGDHDRDHDHDRE
jgi:hypothetical protein